MPYNHHDVNAHDIVLVLVANFTKDASQSQDVSATL